MDTSRLNWLIERYHQNIASAEELKELEDLVAASGNDESVTDALAVFVAGQPADGVDVQPYAHLAEKVLQQHRPRKINTWAWAAAASVLLLAGIWMMLRRPEKPQLSAAPAHTPQAIPPGQYGAVLTLADGSTVMLDSVRSGTVAMQNGIKIVANGNQLSYDVSGSDSEVMAYNTLSTPKGRQFHIQLPDGTEVWLNAGSSIHYPTVFKGKERVVDLTGEAYFEVAKNAAMPFKVNVNGQAGIEVVGTHFNVNAYSNEPDITTTLLEGCIRFHAGQQTSTLQPAQQSKLNVSTRALTMQSNVATDKAIAWKNGLFDFNDASLREVMNQLERWYDIEVVYEKSVPDIRFFGKMTRNITLNDLLMILERSKVHFFVEGRKLIVRP